MKRRTRQFWAEILKTLSASRQILREPNTAPVPREPSGLCAVTAALARRFTAANAAPIYAYAQRLPKEFEVYVRQRFRTRL